MKRLTLYFAMSFTCTILFITSCATQRVNLLDDGIVSIEQKACKEVIIDHVRVYQYENDIAISGRVRRRSMLPSFIRGHVVVTIITPDGAQLKKAGTYYYPRHIQRRRAGCGSTFQVSIPFVPIRGSKVQVEYHNGLKIPSEEKTNLEM